MGARIARFLGKNFLAVIAIFLALGGTAYASFVVSSNGQIGPNTVAGHHPPSGKHANLIGGSVTTADLANNGVVSSKIATGAVSGSKVAHDAITSSKVADGSLTLADLVGTDVTGTIDVTPVNAHSCLTASVSALGAEVGQVPSMGFVGSTPVPGGLVFQALKISSPDAVTIRICNVTDAATADAPDVGVRIITLG